MVDQVVLPPSLVDDLLAHVMDRYPRKCFGYLAAAAGDAQPSAFVGFEDNMRNDERWVDEFESRGRYFVDHPDAGFVATEDESWRVHRYLLARNLHEVAMVHTHRRHPGNFSDIDYDLHVSRCTGLWHLIISLRNVEQPQLRAFAVSDPGVRELRVSTGRVAGNGGQPWVRADGAAQRYAEHVAPQMVALDGGAFDMGTEPSKARHFCGETPKHRVTLSPFLLSRFPVTNGLYALFDPSHAGPATARDLPVVDVSWFDAARCAAWFGCRLPTEAEWEYAGGAGSADDWCCAESALPRHAWYSENAGRERHSVGALRPNAFGLYDLHGNVWEWCQDTYFPDYYGRSPTLDPVATDGIDIADVPHKVSRGGGFLALTEMCRTRYRLHDPAWYSATDLGFRLARDSP